MKAAEQETEDGTVKRSVGVARGQALAVNDPECWKEDCDKPVALVGGPGGRFPCSLRPYRAVMHAWHALRARPDIPHLCPGILPTLPTFHRPPAPLLPAHLPTSQVQTSVTPGGAVTGPKATADAIARGSLLSATRVRTGRAGRACLLALHGMRSSA